MKASSSQAQADKPSLELQTKKKRKKKRKRKKSPGARGSCTACTCMPIAAKLIYFQRRRPPPPPEPEPAAAGTRDTSAARRRVHPLRSASAHHKPGYKIAQGSHRKHWTSSGSGSTIEPTSNRLFSSRLSTTTSNDRLPDAVRQAKERLHDRLQSVDLSLGKRKTTRASGSISISAGPILPSDVATCTFEDGRFNSRTTPFNSNRAKEMTAHLLSSAVEEPAAVLVAPPPEHVWKETSQGTMESGDEESLVDCSICLEGCHDAGGLIQLRCKHIFHSACLEQWLRARGDCPYCRASVGDLSWERFRNAGRV